MAPDAVAPGAGPAEKSRHGQANPPDYLCPDSSRGTRRTPSALAPAESMQGSPPLGHATPPRWCCARPIEPRVCGPSDDAPRRSHGRWIPITGSADGAHNLHTTGSPWHGTGSASRRRFDLRANEPRARRHERPIQPTDVITQGAMKSVIGPFGLAALAALDLRAEHHNPRERTARRYRVPIREYYVFPWRDKTKSSKRRRFLCIFSVLLTFLAQLFHRRPTARREPSSRDRAWARAGPSARGRAALTWTGSPS